jgi:hypothetical protein
VERGGNKRRPPRPPRGGRVRATLERMAAGRPPIGRKGQALAAMGLGAGSVVLWVGLFWPRLSALLGELFAAG